MDEEMTKCRLCNYQSDKRLMLDVFDDDTEYSVKIENYLNIKVNFWVKFEDFRRIWGLLGVCESNLIKILKGFLMFWGYLWGFGVQFTKHFIKISFFDEISQKI